jgi:putative hemolysin
MNNPLGVIIYVENIDYILIKILKFSVLNSTKQTVSPPIIIKNYLRVLEVISSFNCELQ